MVSFKNKMFTPDEMEGYFENTLSFYDEVDLEEFTYDKERNVFVYPCPCGDNFVISVNDLMIGETKATCPSCSLVLRVSFDSNNVEKYCK